MSKTLVTGAGGFIGSHLTELLVRSGHSVRAFVRYNSSNSWGWLEQSEVLPEIEVVRGDIRDYDSVFRATQGCAQIFHLAALIGIPYSYDSPLAYIRTNIEGTYNILQSARALGAENVMVTSTSETYGTAQFVPITESHPLVGQSPYSATKIAADQMAISYYRSFGLPVKIVRPFNTYGPRQSSRAIIPTVITQILAGAERIKLGNLTPTRDLTFVKDTADGFLAISKCDELTGEVTNIGSSFEISMGDLVRKISELCGKEIAIESDLERIRPDQSEVERLFCDNSKIMRYTTWRPAHSLDQGLQATIEWFARHGANSKSDRYTT